MSLKDKLLKRCSVSFEKEGIEELQVGFFALAAPVAASGRREGSAVPQRLNSAGEPMAGFFYENPPVTISSSELEQCQLYTAPKSYRPPLCFISLFTLPQQL